MKHFRVLGFLAVGFVAGIFFVYSCGGGGGSSANADSAELLARVAALEAKTAYMSAVAGTINGLKGPHLIFTGVNLHVQNGLSRTASVNGLGNLIVGLNEAIEYPALADSRCGSHNLVVGPEHRYTIGGGLVAGYYNRVIGDHASVSGGWGNIAGGDYASVSGGSQNIASVEYASVSGGKANLAKDFFSTVSGSSYNTTSFVYQHLP